MGAIPLPALDIQTQKAPSALDTYGRAQQIKGMQQEQEQRGIEMQMEQQQLRDQQALTQSMLNWDGNSYDDLAKSVLKNGGSASAAMGVQQHGIKLRTALSTMQKDQLANLSQRHDLALGAIKAAEGVPDEQLGQHVVGTVQGLMNRGLLDPQEGQQYLSLATLPPDQLRAQLAVHEKQLIGEQQQIANASKEAETNKNTALQKEAEASTAKTQQETRLMQQYGFSSPAQLEMKYLSEDMKRRRGQPYDTGFLQAYKGMKTLVPAFNFNMQNSGAAADNNGNPSQIAQAIANGQMAWKDAVSMRTPMATKNAILSQVFKLNPNFDTAEFGLEQDAAKKARSGAWADTRLAYNTAIDHSQQLLDTIDALNNGDVKKLNSLKNFFKTEFGSPDVPTFQAVANAYNHEVTSVVSKGHITDAEVQSGHAILPDNASPQALRGVVAAYKNLMGSKRDELDKMIRASAGNKANGVMNVQSGGGSNQTADPFAQFGGKARQ